MHKSNFLFGSVLSAISMMATGFGGNSASFAAAAASATRLGRTLTGKRRSRWPSEPGVAGSKRARKAAEHRLTGNQHPR